MKRIILLLFLSLFLIQPSYSFSFDFGFLQGQDKQERAVRNLIKSQVKYANKGNFDKFISTYDKSYMNSDGFNLDVYSKLVKDVWSNYLDIKYDTKIKNITIDDNTAKVELTEYSNAKLPISSKFEGRLNSISESIYYLKLIDNKWKVVSDSVLDETSTMLYGDMMNIPVKLEVPLEVVPDEEYTASLEFAPPEGYLAIASISSEKVTYPPEKAKEVYRAIPEDNILERLFTANNNNLNEYIVASIGLTQADICDLSVKISLAGFGFVVRRVNVVNDKLNESQNEQTK